MRPLCSLTPRSGLGDHYLQICFSSTSKTPWPNCRFNYRLVFSLYKWPWGPNTLCTARCTSGLRSLPASSSQRCMFKISKIKKAAVLEGENTLPLALGDRPARWTVALPVLIRSILCPGFWSLQAFSFATTMALGLGVAVRVIWKRGVDADRFTWKLWCLWLTVLYLLPVFKNHGFVTRFWGLLRTRFSISEH